MPAPIPCAVWEKRIAKIFSAGVPLLPSNKGGGLAICLDDDHHKKRNDYRFGNG